MISGIDTRNSVPVYVQIENLILFAISSGKLHAGDKLSPARELAEQLKVNQNTVVKAYRDLEVMGIITARRGTGVFVRKNVEGKCRKLCRARVLHSICQAVIEAKAALVSREEILQFVRLCYDTPTEPYKALPPGLLKQLR